MKKKVEASSFMTEQWIFQALEKAKTIMRENPAQQDSHFTLQSVLSDYKDMKAFSRGYDSLSSKGFGVLSGYRVMTGNKLTRP